MGKAEELYWHEKQRVRCPECAGCGHDVYGRGYAYDCPHCERGTVARPFVPTAQPITEVRLTAIPPQGLSDRDWGCFAIIDGVLRSPRWPGVTFGLPPG